MAFFDRPTQRNKAAPKPTVATNNTNTNNNVNNNTKFAEEPAESRDEQIEKLTAAVTAMRKANYELITNLGKLLARINNLEKRVNMLSMGLAEKAGQKAMQGGGGLNNGGGAYAPKGNDYQQGQTTNYYGGQGNDAPGLQQRGLGATTSHKDYFQTESTQDYIPKGLAQDAAEYEAQFAEPELAPAYNQQEAAYAQAQAQAAEAAQARAMAQAQAAEAAQAQALAQAQAAEAAQAQARAMAMAQAVQPYGAAEDPYAQAAAYGGEPYNQAPDPMAGAVPTVGGQVIFNPNYNPQAQSQAQDYIQNFHNYQNGQAQPAQNEPESKYIPPNYTV